MEYGIWLSGVGGFFLLPLPLPLCFSSLFLFAQGHMRWCRIATNEGRRGGVQCSAVQCSAVQRTRYEVDG